MLLDAVISHPELEWLATVSDKVDFFAAAASLDAKSWPHLAVGGTRRYFADHLPIAVSPTGPILFVFLATSSRADDLIAVLQRHAELFSAVSNWTVRLVLPPCVAPMKASIESGVRDELTKTPAAIHGSVESEVVPLSYRHLSPLTSLVCRRVKGVEKGEHMGEHTLARPQPRRVERDDDDANGSARDWRSVPDAR
jgi:hypothetical protein